MSIFKRLLLGFRKDERGSTAVEYGLIASGVGIAIIASVQALGSKLTTLFTTAGSAL